MNSEVAMFERIGRVIEQKDALLDALTEVCTWIKNWDPPFVEDEEWPETWAKVEAALKLARQP